ncbi:ABC transporter ATP-binding protein [Actinomycetaceae bacterium WB03_NA08]|uniref:ABC transporter ATP-binding protein n=1 Tax=Scrofimicrobium canadense TaxID=2652290 RepID=A0A6N7VWM3_9ACTO|nr:ABC transporter ATP-binding protein [Scrofimicrobium canadense]MSS85400.1 ABC transporter ATP-binding protein [Scrofimicrobium canadense]
MDPVIVVDEVTKEFTIRRTHSMKESLVWALTGRRKDISDQFRALDSVSFQVGRGESVGLIGFNGSGKSTMLKLISGVMVPDKGFIGTKGKVAGLIEVGAGFHPDLTGRENVYLNAAILGMEKSEIDAVFEEIVDFSEIRDFIDQEVKFYSSGMFLRLAFAVAVYTDPEVFLVDEILAVGDEPFQKKCLARIRQLQEEGRSLVIVSHDLDMIADLCDRGVVLQKGSLVFDGPADKAVEALRAL